MAFANLVVRIAGDISSLDQATRKAVERVRSFGSSLESVGTSLALGITAPLAAFSALALKSSGDLEALRLGLNVVAGSAEKAAKQFTELREVAKLPGLGLQEAVQGSINLQAVGFSADKAKNILLQFGNALAAVGRGREDLNEVIRQLGQLGARGAVTADNLKPIIERVPQVATIIKKNFGPEALGAPAETFKKLGISSQEFIEVLLTELGKVPRVTGGLKNDFENLRDSMTIAFASAGDTIAPFAKSFIDEFAVPAIEMIPKLASGFASLSAPVQGLVVALGAVVAVAPLAITAIGTVITNLTAITAVIGSISAGPVVIALAGITAAVLGLNAAMQLGTQQQEIYARQLNTGGSRIIKYAEDSEKAKKETEEFAKSIQAFKSEAGLGGLTVVVDKVSSALPRMGTASAGAAREVSAFTNAVRGATLESRVLHDVLRQLETAYDEKVKLITRVRMEQMGLVEAEKLEIPLLKQQHASVKDLIAAYPELAREIQNITHANEQLGASQRDLDRLNATQNKQRGRSQVEELARQTKGAVKDQVEGLRTLQRQVSLVTNDLARNLTDLITKGGKFGDVMVAALENIGKSILRLALEKALERIAGKLLDIATAIPGVGKAIGSIFGGAASGAAGAGISAATSAGASAAVGAAGSAAGAGASIAGAAGAAASAGVTAVVGAVSGVVSAISGVIGNFQFAAMNKSLDLIEHEVRFSQIHLLHILEKINLHLPWLDSIHARLVEFRNLGVKIEGGLAGAGGGGTTIHIAQVNISGSNGEELLDDLVRALKARGVA